MQFTSTARPPPTSPSPPPSGETDAPVGIGPAFVTILASRLEIPVPHGAKTFGGGSSVEVR